MARWIGFLVNQVFMIVRLLMAQNSNSLSPACYVFVIICGVVKTMSMQFLFSLKLH